MQPSQRTLWAQTINLAAEVEDLEEEEFLVANPSIVPVFDIYVMVVLGLSLEDSSKVNNTMSLGALLTKAQIFELQTHQRELSKEDKYQEQVEAVKVVEQRYEDQLSKLARIAEEELQDLNLGTKDEPKNVKIGKSADFEFLKGLKSLLQEFKDVFAWDYSEMKDIALTFHQHHINLKQVTISII